MRKDNLEQMSNAINQFNVIGKIRGCMPYGNGHINNNTLVIVTYEDDGTEHKYILQAVNDSVFK